MAWHCKPAIACSWRRYVSLTILSVILEIKFFSTTFFEAEPWLARLVLRFSCRFPRGTSCCLHARWVKYRRATSNRFTTRNGNCHVRFLKMQGTDSRIDFFSSFTEHDPLSSPSHRGEWLLFSGHLLTVGENPQGVLPCMGYIGMCGPKGYGFSAVLVINWVSILAILPPF